MNTGLPIADNDTVRKEVRGLIGVHKRQFGLTIVLYGFASAAGLAAPYLLGQLIDGLDAGGARIDAIAATVGGIVVLGAIFAGLSHFTSNRLGETIMARLREDFVRRCLTLPLPTVEKAGTGDLMTRSSRDITQLGQVLRRAAPEILINLMTVVLTLVALAIASPFLALVALGVTLPLLWGPARWYLRRASAAYLTETAAYSQIAENLAATVESARTVESLGIAQQRLRQAHEDIAGSYRAERGTLRLRSVLFPALDFCVTIPVAAVLLVGGLMYAGGSVSLGEVAAATLYTNQAGGPVFMLLGWLDELQTGQASLARVIGVDPTPDVKAPAPMETEPDGAAVRARGVRYAYSPGHEVLHGIDLNVARGERLAIVGPSGAGKSTLGRLFAGIDSPTTGSVTVAGRDVSRMPLEELRREVLLVTQEHHVFLGTLRDNLALAAPDAEDARILEALATVDATAWLEELSDGLDTEVGSAATPVSAARAQQVALARLVLADPEVLVLDEATSLIDPRAARRLEGQLNAVLSGRTVIAIAHRLHTAHDADRIAVVTQGRVSQLGPHHELAEADGDYARLWTSWRGADAA